MSVVVLYNNELISDLPIKETTTFYLQGTKGRTNIQVVESDDIATTALSFSQYEDGLDLGYQCNGGVTNPSILVIPSTYNGKQVISIGGEAFRENYATNTLILPHTIRYIHYGAFYGWRNIKNLAIPDTVTTIGENAFGWNTINTLTIGKGVKSIGAYAFRDCYSLQRINFNGTIAQWNAIQKDSTWNSGVPAVRVYCSDGYVTI